MEDQVKYEKKPDQAKKTGNELALLKKDITDSVMERISPMIESKEIRLPSGFSVGNALHSAWFVLLETKNKDGRSVLQTCTKESIANSLFKMSIWGLSVAKKQVAFIAYGNQLNCQPEYHGNMALAKRYGGIAQINSGVIYKNDVFKYSVNTETGRKKLIEHTQELENINDEQIRGAYCILTFTDGSEPYLEVMSFEQIKKAWMQGAAKGGSPAHKNFGGEMAKKTVINRACKLFISSSDDAALFEEEESSSDAPLQSREQNKAEKGNKKELTTQDIDYEDISGNGREPEIPPEQLEPQGPQEPKESPFPENPY